MKTAIFAAIFSLSTIASIQSAYAEVNGKFSIETGVEYYSGKYGGTQSTDILYVPVTGKLQVKDWTFKMTVPYLQITGPGNVVNGIGQTVVATTRTRPARSGMGDIVIAATRNVYNGGPAGLIVSLTGKVKLGTADSAQGLGTGMNDYSIESTLSQTFEDVTAFGTVGYRMYGSPATYTLNNVFYGSLGGSYKVDQETNAGVMFIASQKLMAIRSNRAEALVFVSHKLERNWKIQGHFLKGFTNSVPDWGGGILVDYLF